MAEFDVHRESRCTNFGCIPTPGDIAPGCEDVPDEYAREPCTIAALTGWDRLLLMGPGIHGVMWSDEDGFVNGDAARSYPVCGREDEECADGSCGKGR